MIKITTYFKNIFVIILALSAFLHTENISAQKKKGIFSRGEAPSVKSNQKLADFDLNREITIYSGTNSSENTMMCSRIMELLKSKGVQNLKIGRNKEEININVSRVDSIVGVDSNITDAYCIKVYKNEVEVQYMSAKSMAWTFQALSKIIVEDQTFLQKMMNRKSLYIQASSLCETSGSSGSFEIIDLTTNKMNVEAIKSYINRAALNNKFIIYLKLISTEGVAVMSELINSVNPFIELANGGLTYNQLNELYTFAYDNGIEIIPLLDLTTENNNYFEYYTGHKIHSTEGLRFSKALINEFAMKTPYNVICIGGEPANETIKTKYIDPIVELLNNYERDVVIHTNQ